MTEEQIRGEPFGYVVESNFPDGHPYKNVFYLPSDISTAYTDNALRITPLYAHFAPEAAPTQALAPLSEGALMGVYMDFDRNAERTWLPAEYLLRFAAAVQQAVLKGVQP